MFKIKPFDPIPKITYTKNENTKNEVTVHITTQDGKTKNVNTFVASSQLIAKIQKTNESKK